MDKYYYPSATGFFSPPHIAGVMLFIILLGLSASAAPATPPSAYRTQSELLSIKNGQAYIYFTEDIEPGNYYLNFNGKRLLKMDLSTATVQQLKNRQIKHYSHPDTPNIWHEEVVNGDTIAKKQYLDRNSFAKFEENPFIFDDTDDLIFKTPREDTTLLKTREQIIDFLDEYPLGFPGTYYSFEYFSNPRVQETYRAGNYLLVKFRFDNYDYGRWQLDYSAILPVEGPEYLARIKENKLQNFNDILDKFHEELAENSFYAAYRRLEELRNISKDLPDIDLEEKLWSKSYREKLLSNKNLLLYLDSGRYFKPHYERADEKLRSISAGRRHARTLELPLEWRERQWEDPALLRVYMRIIEDKWDEVGKVIAEEPLYFSSLPKTTARIKEYANFARQYLEKNDVQKIERGAGSYFWEIERYLYFAPGLANRKVLDKVHGLSSYFLNEYPDHYRTNQVWWYKNLAAYGLQKEGEDIDWPDPEGHEDSAWYDLRQALFEGEEFEFSADFLIGLMGTSLLFEDAPLALPVSNFLEQKDTRRFSAGSWTQERYYWECLFALQQELSPLSRYHLQEASIARPEEILPEKRDWIFQAMAADYFARNLPGGWTFEDNPEPVFRRWGHFSKMDADKIPLLTYYSAGSLLYSQQKTWQSLVDLSRLKKLSGENNPFAWDESTVSELAGELIDTLDKKEWPAAPGFPRPVERFENLPRSNYFSSRPESFTFDTTPEGYSFKLEFSLAQPAGQICRPPAIAFLDHRSGGFFRPEEIEINDSIIAEWHWEQEEINRLRQGHPTMAREWTPRYYIAIVPFCSGPEKRFPVERITETDYKPPYETVENIKITSGKITPQMLE